MTEEQNADTNKLFLVLLLAGIAYYYFYVLNGQKKGQKKQTGNNADPQIGGVFQPQVMPDDFSEAMGMPETSDYEKWVKYYTKLKQTGDNAEKQTEVKKHASSAQQYAKVIMRNPTYKKYTKEAAALTGNSFNEQLMIEAYWLMRQGSKFKNNKFII